MEIIENDWVMSPEVGWSPNEGLELQVMENDVVKTRIGGN